MAVTFREKFKSGRIVAGANPSSETIHLADVVGETDENLAVEAEALATLPNTYNNKPRQSFTVEQVGNGLWTVTTIYAYTFSSFVLPPGGESESFDTTGGTRRLTQSIRTVGRYAPETFDARNFGGAIGVGRNGVEGVDIRDNTYGFRVVRSVAESDVTDFFKALIYGLTSRVNTETFKGFPPGSVLFGGATGTQKSETEWEVVYNFLYSPNETDITVGDISGIDKLGWDYLWVLYGEAVDETAQAFIQTPISVYVEEVYKRGDLNALFS